MKFFLLFVLIVGFNACSVEEGFGTEDATYSDDVTKDSSSTPSDSVADSSTEGSSTSTGESSTINTGTDTTDDTTVINNYDSTQTDSFPTVPDDFTNGVG